MMRFFAKFKVFSVFSSQKVKVARFESLVLCHDRTEKLIAAANANSNETMSKTKGFSGSFKAHLTNSFFNEPTP